MALQAVAQAMYSDAFWDQLSEALAAAQDGDGSGLLALWDAYYHRQPDGTWRNFLEAFQAIRCMDQAERPTVAEDDATVARHVEVAAPVPARHHDRHLLLHVLPAVDRAPWSRSPAPAPARSS